MGHELKKFRKQVANPDRNTGVGISFSPNKDVMCMVVINKKNPKSVGFVVSLTQRVGLELWNEGDGWEPSSVIPNVQAMVKLPIPEIHRDEFMKRFEKTFPAEGIAMLDQALKIAQDDLASKIETDLAVKA